MASIVAYQFEGLLYILGGCLLFLLASPRLHANPRSRKLLYIFLVTVLMTAYIVFADIDPLQYVLHLLPISIIYAALFEGGLPGFYTWFAFNFCCLFLLEVDRPLTVLALSLVTLICALVVHYRRKARVQRWRFHLASLALTALYGGLQFLAVGTSGLPLQEWLLTQGGAAASMLVISYVYYQTRSQELLLEQLIHAEKYHIIGQMAASISHEIRNPLTASMGFLQLMGKTGLSEEQQQQYRQHAIQGIKQADAIISEYLKYAKPAEEKYGPIHVQQLIDELAPWIQPYTTLSGIHLQITHATLEPLFFNGESRKLQQILINLMKNAIEAMPDGGEIRLSTRNDTKFVYILIEDAGIGMTPEQLKQIGMPFYTTKENGTGLGLMAVRSMIQSMGGVITYKSELGVGTTCQLRFRLSTGTVAAE